MTALFCSEIKANSSKKHEEFGNVNIIITMIKMKRYTDILLYVPNLIGYLRILLLLVGCCMHSEVHFIVFIIISAALDVTDGIAARQLRQESAFGEWFDIVIDLFTRGLLWSWSFPLFGFLVFGFEFLVFVSVHCSGYSWQNKKREMHWLASLTVSKGFKTPFGVVAMIGLWVLPVLLLCVHSCTR
ncbi:CDP-diacylglycerol--inositol 3-phosphatidyltransferase-like [Hydractinia symbiolongicarpus]|uniref:CDP-diacylglycerol--inositol 3-phosphatidyltransferase-like n=1 Tax=Hydractinia symbiolongicarpus TaxID=13093 RepID=UPI00254E3D6F|nr:CDP-diacylglycerol--inositol 3-phosphatidyltransferase-like [Hydractinia symbiolongicarpus]